MRSAPVALADSINSGSALRNIIKRHGPFDFALRSHSSANDRVCYTLESGDYSFDDKDMDGTDIVTDFTITKSELNGTIDKLLKSFERYEEYDKCSEILKLQKSLKSDTFYGPTHFNNLINKLESDNYNNYK